MSVINLTNFSNKKSREALLTFNLDTDELVQYLNKTNTKLKETAKSPKVLETMAKAIILVASESELIPRKEEYQIRPDKKKKQLRGESGKVIKYQKGNKKGKPKYASFSPDKYYYHMRDLTTKERTIKNVPVYAKDKHTILRYEDRVDPRMSVRDYWKEVYASPEYNKTYRTDYKETVIKSGNRKGHTFTTKRYYSDRPPHLSDVGDTHIVTVKNGLAQIKLSAKKPKDKRFYEEGGVQYAYAQYFAYDVDWNREEEHSTSRWLEVAIGLPVPGATKITNYSYADENLQDVIDIMKKAINQKVVR